MHNELIVKCLHHLSKFKQTGNIKLSDQEVLNEYVKVFSEITSQDEIKEIFRELKSHESAFYPSIGDCYKACGYLSTEAQKDRCAYEIYRYIIEVSSGKKARMSFTATHIYESLGRMQTINLRLDDPHGLSYIKKLVERVWSRDTPRYGRITEPVDVLRAYESSQSKLTDGETEKKR